jgi:hypothetical protein
MAATKKVITSDSKPSLVPVTDIAQRDAIVGAIAALDPRKAPEWKELANLLPGAKVDAIEAEGVFKSGDDFEASATVYVIIPGAQGQSTDSFSAHIGGRLGKNNKVEIQTFNMNTSSFFGGSAFPWQSMVS